MAESARFFWPFGDNDARIATLRAEQGMLGLGKLLLVAQFFWANNGFVKKREIFGLTCMGIQKEDVTPLIDSLCSLGILLEKKEGFSFFSLEEQLEILQIKRREWREKSREKKRRIPKRKNGESEEEKENNNLVIDNKDPIIDIKDSNRIKYNDRVFLSEEFYKGLVKEHTKAFIDEEIQKYSDYQLSKGICHSNNEAGFRNWLKKALAIKRQEEARQAKFQPKQTQSWGGARTTPSPFFDPPED